MIEEANEKKTKRRNIKKNAYENKKAMLNGQMPLVLRFKSN